MKSELNSLSIDILKLSIEKTYSELSSSPSKGIDEKEHRQIQEVITYLNHGQLRVCEKTDNQWITHEWLKKAILLYFRIQKVSLLEAGDFNFMDKIPVKKWTGTENVRSVPMALVRKGAYIEEGVILMPSFVNIGAYVSQALWWTLGPP